MTTCLHAAIARLPIILGLGLGACEGPQQPDRNQTPTQPSHAVNSPNSHQQLESRANSGDAQACQKLGAYYDKQKEYRQAFKWYEKAAAAGNPSAWHNLGVMYELGQGVPQNLAQAAFHYRQATTKGNLPSAWHNMGLLYAEGNLGQIKDSKTAFEFFKKAAEQNFAPAQRAVAHALATGQGVSLNLAQAVKWYLRAANLNDAEAQYDLGLCLATNRGAERDLVEAYKWINLAAVNPKVRERAIEARMLLEMSMTPMQIQEGQTRSQQWLEAHKSLNPTDN